jgi:hypothetical protein
MRHYLRLSSVIFLVFLASCAGPYKHLQKQETAVNSALIYTPVFEKALYRCLVDGNILLKKFHLSGILLFKKTENGTIRAVFQNEMGYTWFDLEWDSRDSFQVNQVIQQLNKPAIIKTVKKDMELLMMKGLNPASEALYKKGEEWYHRFDLTDGGYAYYIEQEGRIIRIENATEKKKIITVKTLTSKKTNDMPGAAYFEHHKANFIIKLDKLESDVNE